MGVKVYELTIGQQGVLLDQRLSPGVALLNIGGRLTARGPLDVSALRLALGRVTAETDALRLRLVDDVQRSDAVVHPPAVVDLSALEHAEEHAQRLMALEMGRPFQLEGALCRFLLLRVEPQRHHLLAVFHHVIVDGVAVSLFGQRIAAWYESLRLRGPEPAAVPFFLELLEKRSQGAAEGTRYWSERLRRTAPRLFPTPAAPDPASRRRRVGLQDLKLDSAALPRLLPAALAVVLHRTHHCRELLLGMATHNRRTAAEKRTIGLFVDLMPLPVTVPPGLTCGDLVSTLGAELRAGYRHRTAAELIRRRLVADGSLGAERRLFEVVVSYEPQAFPVRLGPATAEILALPSGFSPHPLNVTVRGPRLDLEAQRAFFDDTALRRLGAQLRRLIATMARDPARPLAALDLLSRAERHQVSTEWNDIRAEPGGGLVHELFRAQTAHTPEAVAVVGAAAADATLTVSYGELGARAADVSRRLRARGVGPEARVGVELERTPALIAALLGVLEAGGAYVGLDPEYPAERLRFMVEDAGLDLVVREDGIRGEDGVQGRAVDGTAGPARPENLAWMIYTSGSTGRPKGVAVTHGNAAALLRWASRAFRDAELAGVLASTSVCFDLSIFEIFVPLSRGGCLILVGNALALAELPERDAVTLLNTVPSAAAELECTGALAGVRTVNLAGEALEPPLVDALYARGAERVHDLYGPSEDTTYSTWTQRERHGPATIGRPVDGGRAYLLDPDLRPVPAGATGEICLSGAGVARGYLGRPAETARGFLPDPFARGGRLYRTGDLGRHLHDGRLKFLGRRDHQVKVRGFRVELGEVETALASHPAVRAAAAAVRDQRLVAFVETERTEPWAAFLRERLPVYLVPAFFVELESLPRLPNGKVDRGALEGLISPDESRESTAPRTPTEEILAEIFATVLGGTVMDRERIGVHDSFFDLGGHSLLATQVLSRLREAFGVELTLRDFFDTPRVTELAERVEQARHAGVRRPAPPLERAAGSSAQLSFAQQRLWFLDRLQGASATYNVPVAIELEGSLDVRALEGAFGEIVWRHEALRTSFTMHEGVARQVIHPPRTRHLPVVDLSAFEPAGRRRWRDRLVRAEAARPFDLERGPLMRLLLVRTGTREHQLLVNLHHVVCDGWSIGVMARELNHLYPALGADPSAPVDTVLPELAVQYADYALWQRKWFDGPVLEALLDWWRDELDGVPALELPTDRPRPTVASPRGGTRRLVLPAALTGELKALARTTGTTLFMTLLAAFEVLLRRWNAQRDFAVGTPVAGRGHVALEPLIGFFVNTLVVRSEPSARDFKELSRRVRNSLLEVYAHQDLPFERLADALDPARDPSRALVQVVFTLQNAPLDALELPGLQAAARALGTGTAKFDLDVVMAEVDGRLDLRIEYPCELFDGSTITRLARGFEALLRSVAQSPERALGALGLLTAAERHQSLVEWNQDAGVDAEAFIHEIFAARAGCRPEAVALVLDDPVSFKDTALTYGELARRAERVAGHLRALATTREPRVGIYLERSFEMVVAVLATLESDGVYVPLDPDYPPRRLRWMVADARIDVVLTRTSLASRWGEPATHLLALDALEDKDPIRPVAFTRDARQAAYVTYTSGSTGRPKGVEVPHRAVVRLVREASYVDLDGSQTLLAAAPLAFDASTFELWGALLHGARCVLMAPGPTDAARLRERIESGRVTTLWLTSSLFNAVIDEDPRTLSLPRQLLIGGEALSVPHVREYRRHCPDTRLVNGYGPTENTTFTCCDQVPAAGPESGRTRIPIGRAIGGTRVRVFADSTSPVGIGGVGELYASGLGLARGYTRRGALTAGRFLPDPTAPEPGARMYRTGDLVRYLTDGRLDFLGRIDHQVKVRGFRVEVGEIEAVLAGHRAVRSSAVVAREQRLVGFLELDVEASTGEASTGEVREYLRARLPDYMVPSLLVSVEALPMLRSGKVDRGALAREAVPEAMPEPGDVPARTPSEEILAGIFASLLGRGRVGRDASFFELGGHSLLATQAVARIREAFGVELPLHDFFATPRVAGLAERVEAARVKRPRDLAPILPVRRDAPLPLSFTQERLWFLDRLESGDGAYHLPACLRLKGALDVSALAAGLGEVVRRHEVLRTRFVMAGTEPRQEVMPAEPITLGVVALDKITAPEAEVRRQAVEQARRPFDLARGPLLRAALLRLARHEHLLLLTLHHVVADGWSIAILTREVAAAYRCASAGTVSSLPELPVQYGDFACWQRRQDAVPSGQLAYWRRRLAVPIPAPDLPVDRSRAAARTGRGARRASRLSGELSARTRRLGESAGASLFMVLLTALVAVLHRLTGQRDLLVGFPVAGRRRIETESLIGCFVNTLVLRTRIPEGRSFAGLLTDVRVGCLEAYENQEVPFEKVLEALEVDRDPNRPSLFQVFFNMLNFPDWELDLPGLEAELRPGAVTGAKFDLTLYAADDERGIALDALYDAGLFSQGRIVEMLDQVSALLSQAVEDPERDLAAYSLVTPRAAAILPDPRAPIGQARAEQLVHEMFAARARERPDRVAVVDGLRAWSYGDVQGRVAGLARALGDAGVDVGDVVAIDAHRGAPLVWALLGVLEAGAAFMVLDPSYPAERLAACVRAVEPWGWIRIPAGQEEVTLMPGVETPGCRRSPFGLQGPAGERPGGDRLAYVAFTSGTTGVPKGILGGHRPVSHFLRWYRQRLELDDDDRFSLLSGLPHDPLLRDVFAPLTLGATLTIPSPEILRSPHRLVRWLNEQRVSVANVTPALGRMLLGGEALSGLRRLCLGGDVLTCRDAGRLADLAPRATLFNFYGATETPQVAGFFEVGREDVPGSVPIGHGIDDVELLIVNDRQQPAGLGELGEIWVRSAYLSLGYVALGNSADDDAAFLVNPLTSNDSDRVYRTGDLGRYRLDGGVEFLGRRDRQVKVRGHRVEPREVEVHLRAHPGVRDAAVTLRGDLPSGEGLVAYVVNGAVTDGGPGVEELRRHLRRHLPEAMVPSAFVSVGAIPLTPNAKVDFGVLPPPPSVRPDLERRYTAPESGVEQTVAGIFQSALGLDRLGVHDNFFDLGGHSLLLVKVHQELREALETDIKMVDLFRYPTVRRLAQHLNGTTSEPDVRRARPELDRGKSRLRQLLGKTRSARPRSPRHRSTQRSPGA